MKKSMLRIAFVALLVYVFLPIAAVAQFDVAEGFELVWTLDPREHTDLFPRGPAFGAKMVEVGMDMDNDGKKEILFATDETLAPYGPDPGYLDIYLFEALGDNDYGYVWHYTMPEGSNSLAALAYGDMDQDGRWEIFFGVPTIDNANKLFVFEQDAAGVFPDAPTVTWDYDRDAALDFRPSGFAIADVDGDGDIELVTQSRTSGRRELVVASLATESLDEFADFKIEFEAGEDLLGGGAPYDVDVYDFDGDGLNEIWFNTWDKFSFTIFEAVEADSYALQIDLNQLFDDYDPGSFNSHKLHILDIDDDGLMEAWFPMSNGKLYFLDDDEDVSTLTADNFVEVGSFMPTPTMASRGSDVGDIDDDGMLDIIATHGTGEKVSRIEYLGIGSPADSSSYEWSILLESEGEPTERYYPCRIAPMDLDGDGFKEVVLTNLYASEEGQPLIMVLEYNPETAEKMAYEWQVGNTLNHTDVDSLFASDFSGNSRTAIAGMDLDQDGAEEVILNDYVSAGVHLFEYDAMNDVFELKWSSPVDTVNNRNSYNPRTVVVGDMDMDGRWEIIFARASDPSGWYVYEWDGVAGSDNYGTVYSSIIDAEIDVCCASDPTAFRGDHEAANICDVDGDGQHELLVGIRRNASGGQRGTLIVHCEGDIDFEAAGGGFETWVAEFFVDRGFYGGGSPYQTLPADLDGDGTWEIVNHTWNNFNFYNVDVLGADSYQAPDTAAANTKKNVKLTSNDDVALFGGGAGDIDGNGDDEVFFPAFYGGDMWVIDYEPGDNVLDIDESHAAKIVPGIGSAAGTFYASVFDVDKNGRANLFCGSTYPRTITSTELIGDDPRDPAHYQTSVIYTGEPDVFRNITVVDSAGVVTTSKLNTGAFASKVQSHFMGEALDFDDDGQFELVASFQGNQDSITTTTFTWNENTADWDTTVNKVVNPKSWVMMRFEFTGMATGVVAHDMAFITPDDYVLKPNYPNPFNPSTTIEYALPIRKQISVKIYNIMGQLVRTLVDNQLQTAGTHKVMWDGKNENGVSVSSGSYIYTLEFGNFRKSNQMTLIK